jgi:S1-C subfamily serine protease
MSLVDVLIVLLAFGAVVRGYHIGFIRQAGSTLGFIVGLFAGSWLSNQLIVHLDTPLDKSLVSLLVVLTVSFGLMSLGELGSIWLKRRLLHPLFNRLDGSFGSAMGALTTLVAVWLVGSILLLAPAGGWQQAMKSSRILAVLSEHLPPATKVLSNLNRLIDPNGFPEVFTGLEPSPKTYVPPPSLASFASVIANAQPSVVKVEGTGCGGIVEGSGFVAADGRVVTNAHVVAGVASPKVIDKNGIHNTTVTWFDPDIDLALLRVSQLAGKPLPIDTTNEAAGTGGVVLGYPGGGSFTAQSASVLDRFIAVGRNIYGQDRTVREVYSLQAVIRAGNSGGPLVGQDGKVHGIVFATSTQYNDVGYALTGQQTAGELSRAEHLTTPVGTGSCSE